VIKAWIEVQNGDEVLVTQFLDPTGAHEAQQELEYERGLAAWVVRWSPRADDAFLVME
jgi:hypothetical protein